MPRRLSPSDAIQNKGQPIVLDSASQASRTVEISLACVSPSSCLHVPDAMKGREPVTWRLLDNNLNENMVAYR